MPLQCVGGGSPTAQLQVCSTRQQLQLHTQKKMCLPRVVCACGLRLHVATDSLLFCWLRVCGWGLCRSFGDLLVVHVQLCHCRWR